MKTVFKIIILITFFAAPLLISAQDYGVQSNTKESAVDGYKAKTKRAQKKLKRINKKYIKTSKKIKKYKDIKNKGRKLGPFQRMNYNRLSNKIARLERKNKEIKLEAINDMQSSRTKNEIKTNKKKSENTRKQSKPKKVKISNKK